VQVVVVGAGIIGTAVAESLARAGASVTVLDMRAPGQGASHASAGMLTPYVEADGHPGMVELGARSLALYDSLISRLSAEGRAPIEYSRTGILEVALDDDSADRLLNAKPGLDDAGVMSEWLDGDALRGFEPSVTPAALGGLFTAEQGLVGVEGLLVALVQQARLSGAVFEFPVEVTSIEEHTNHAVVSAGAQTYTADAVVLASGSWSRRVRIAGVPSLPMRPVRGQLLHLHWCEGDQPGHIVWGSQCYAVPWSDGSLLVGATVEDVGFDEGATVSGVSALTSSVIELLPHASGARMEAVRVGLRPALPDGLPAIGPFADSPRVVAATGHYRSGVLLAPVTAEIVRRYLIDGVSDPAFAYTSPNRPITVPPRPHDA
jgi:glycine oxidase